MIVPTSQLIDTARRFDERKNIQKAREKDLKKVQWKANMDVVERIKVLKQIDSKERVEKRLKRLGTEAMNYMQTSNESLSNLFTQDLNAFDEVLFERILGQKDLLNINFLEKGSVVARSVGKVVLKNSLGGTIGYGTGFLISPRLLMTNNHVLRDSRDALYSHIEFDNQLDLTGNLLKSTIYKLDPAAFFVTNKLLDVSVVALKASAINNSIGWNKLIEEEGKILIGEYMNIIQHPDGRPKEFSFRANQLTDVLPQFLHYETDTEPGSSGSPVYNDQWEVVGLHHSGVPKRNAEGKILNKNNQVWLTSMGEAQIQWIANEGVRISSIIQYLKNLSIQGSERKFRNEIFEADPPKYQLCYLNNEQYQKLFQPAAPESNSINRMEDGSFVYNIPIRLKIQIGETPTIPAAIQPGQIQTQVVSDIADGSIPKGQVANQALNQEMQEALIELEAGRSKKYYNAEKDKQNRDLYYKGIKRSNISEDAFYKQLKDLLQDTHSDELPYRPAKFLYTWVDLQPNKMLRSIYSGKEYRPEQIIEEDFRSEMRLLEFTEGLQVEALTLSDQQLADKIAVFEASLPYNCEHVVPQSWFAKKDPMRGDLHHLFTCESGCNSFRGNTPYFDFTDFEEVVRTDCGKREQNRFEPENGKGEIARSTLYFLLRYPGEINANGKEYTEDRIATLLDWHENFKVTEHEKHRNAAIFAKQGNRNPLIDFPDWASKINFLKGLG